MNPSGESTPENSTLVSRAARMNGTAPGSTADLEAAEAFRLLSSLAISLDLTVKPSDVVSDPPGASEDPLAWLLESAKHSGISLQATRLVSDRDASLFLDAGYVLLIVPPEGPPTLVDGHRGKQFEATVVDNVSTQTAISPRSLRKLIDTGDGTRVFVGKPDLQCDALSQAPEGDVGGPQQRRLSPQRRFLALLNMDRRDLHMVVLFALVSGVLTLATPLAVESLVNVVSWGIYVQPLIVLAMILLVCLGIAGVLKILHAVVVELIQRRQFVRIVGDLSHRFPRANRASMKGYYPRELANRVFDIMTIQKATAVLLLDGISIILTTVIGLFMLAFYHPFLLGFDIVLVLTMVSMTWMLGRGGVRTAIVESKTKYRVAHWLQDVISSPSAFKVGGGALLSSQRANQLTSDYLRARKRQFRVVIRQIAFAIGLQVVASTALLALGGWLVINRQLTLGQLVASELVVTVVVGAFAKAGKSLEKFYDLMAGIDKVGQLVDLKIDPMHRPEELPEMAVSVRWNQLTDSTVTHKVTVPPGHISAGARVAVVGDDVVAKELLVDTITGMRKPSRGQAIIGRFDSLLASSLPTGEMVGYAGRKQVFHGTIRENIELGRPTIGTARIHEVNDLVGLADLISVLPKGLTTQLQTDGAPLSRIQICQLLIARAVVARPRLLVLDGVLDELPGQLRSEVWERLTNLSPKLTIVVVSNDASIVEQCDQTIRLDYDDNSPEPNRISLEAS